MDDHTLNREIMKLCDMAVPTGGYTALFCKNITSGKREIFDAVYRWDHIFTFIIPTLDRLYIPWKMQSWWGFPDDKKSQQITISCGIVGNSSEGDHKTACRRFCEKALEAWQQKKEIDE